MPYDEIAADLPPPGDDEPESLRQDLLDELADHLTCAMARETQLEQVVRQDPGSTAWGRVVARFENPRAVMFRLWRDAMWERLMMQRVVSWMMIVTLGALCLGMVFVVRSVNQQQLAMAQQQQAMALQQQEIAATLQRISEQSAREAAASKTAASIEWVPVEIRLASAEAGEAVPKGFKVRLSRTNSQDSMPPWEAVIDESSYVRFPMVHYGTYQLRVLAPWGESTMSSVNIHPGTPLSLTVGCPTAALQPISVRPEFVLPDDLKQRPLHITFPLGTGVRIVGDWTWSADFLMDGRRQLGSSLRVGADGQLRPETSDSRLDDFLEYDTSGRFQGIRWRDPSLKPQTCYIQIEREIEELDNVKVLADGTMVGKKLRRLFLVQEPFEVGHDLRFDVSTKDRRLTIEPTESGLRKLRRALAQFDAADDQYVTSHFGGTEYPARLLPVVPEQRP